MSIEKLLKAGMIIKYFKIYVIYKLLGFTIPFLIFLLFMKDFIMRALGF